MMSSERSAKFLVGALALAGIALFTGQVALAPSVPAAPGSQYSLPSGEFGGQAIRPIPQSLDLDPAKVALGQLLFSDPRLSSDNTVACSTCHNLATGGVDRQARSHGVGGREGEINTPTVFNSAFSFAFFWDGRAANLEVQVDGPLKHPSEMGSSWQQVISKLEADPHYFATFKTIYVNGITADNVKDAIASFERSLITPNSRFDMFLRGQVDALTREERAGYEMFRSYGCIACHQGVNIGGNMFQTFGVVGDYFADRGEITDADLGRFNVTGEESDWHVFKVPSLRNVELTPPYFHDGSAATLEEAVRVMGRYQLGRSLSETEINRLVAFLRTLTGELRDELL